MRSKIYNPVLSSPFASTAQIDDVGVQPSSIASIRSGRFPTGRTTTETTSPGDAVLAEQPGHPNGIDISTQDGSTDTFDMALPDDSNFLRPPAKRKPTILDDPAVAQAMAQILDDARTLFRTYGNKKDDCVSLREAGRIIRYALAFSEVHEPAHLVASTLWLMLGTGLTSKELTGQLGTELKAKIAAFDVPNKIASADVAAALERVIEPKKMPTTAADLDPVLIFQRVKNAHPFFSKLSWGDFYHLIGLSADRFEPDVALAQLDIALGLGLSSEDKNRIFLAFAHHAKLDGDMARNLFHRLDRLAPHPLDTLRFEAIHNITTNPSFQNNIDAVTALDTYLKDPDRQMTSYTKTFFPMSNPKAIDRHLKRVLRPGRDDARRAMHYRNIIDHWKLTDKQFETVIDRIGALPINPKDAVSLVDSTGGPSITQQDNDALMLRCYERFFDNPQRRAIVIAYYEANGVTFQGANSLLKPKLLHAPQDQDEYAATLVNARGVPDMFRWLAMNTHLTADQLDQLITTMEESSITPEERIIATGLLFRHLNLNDSHRTRLYALLSQTSEASVVSALAKALKSPELPDDVRAKYRAKIASIDPVSVIENVNLDDISEIHKTTLMSWYDELVDQIERAQEGDNALRISRANGDPTDLDDNVRVLAGILAAAPGSTVNSNPRIVPARDFDHTIVSAHKLMNRAVQALAVNRFLIIPGEPATGKSEVGRHLGDILNWSVTSVTAHRFLMEEELMQHVGVVADRGSNTFTIVDGPLLGPVTSGGLFILNEVNLAKSGNLAFLLNLLGDVNKFVDVYDPTRGATVRRPIHPNFRLIATLNPEGMGTKDLNEALEDRAIVLRAEPYKPLEMGALLRSRQPGLEQRYPSIADNLVQLYADIGMRIASRAMGTHAEGYVWTLRHLMRLTDTLARYETLSPDIMIRAAYDTMGATFLPGNDRTQFFDALKAYTYGGIAVSDAVRNAFIAQQDSMHFARVLRNFGIDEVQGMRRMAYERLTDIPTSARFLWSIIWAYHQGHHAYIKGPKGTGKTKLAAVAAKLFPEARIFGDQLTPQADATRLKGELKPAKFGTKLGFTYVPAPLVNALRESMKTSNLVACILDEAAFARPDVLEELNGLLDRGGSIWVPREDGTGMEELKPGPGFRLVLASNLYGYQGVNQQADAFRSRFLEIYMGYEYGVDEVAAILQGK